MEPIRCVHHESADGGERKSGGSTTSLQVQAVQSEGAAAGGAPAAVARRSTSVEARGTAGKVASQRASRRAWTPEIWLSTGALDQSSPALNWHSRRRSLAGGADSAHSAALPLFQRARTRGGLGTVGKAVPFSLPAPVEATTIQTGCDRTAAAPLSAWTLTEPL